MAADLPHGTQDDLRSRTIRGARILAVRGFALKLVGAFGTLALVRFLSPEDFGVVAFGLAFVAFAQVFTEGGLAAALIRSRDEPTLVELSTLRNVQVLLTGTLAALLLVLGTLTGRTLVITGLLMLAIPLGSLRVPAAILLEREVRYGPIAAAEVVGQLSYLLLSLGCAVAGLGPYALVVGALARAGLGSAYLLRARPVPVRFRCLDLQVVRTHLPYGLRLQLSNIATLGRDQGGNLLVAAVAGTSVLGVLTLARSLVQIPLQLVRGFYRVSFTAMSHLVRDGRGLDTAVRQVAATTLLPTALLCVGITAAAPAMLPILFGDTWRGAVPAVPWALAAVVLVAPLGVAAAGALQASDRVGRLTWSIVLSGAVTFVGIALLAPARGAEGAAVAGLIGSLVELLVLVLSLRPLLQAGTILGVLCSVAVPLAVLTGVALVAASAPATLLWGLLLPVGACVLVLVVLVLLRRADTIVALRAILPARFVRGA